MAVLLHCALEIMVEESQVLVRLNPDFCPDGKHICLALFYSCLTCANCEVIPCPLLGMLGFAGNGDVGLTICIELGVCYIRVRRKPEPENSRRTEKAVSDTT
jgi:hypothetical protein